MTSILSSIGWFGFASGLIYYIIRDRYGDVTRIEEYVWHTQIILIISAGLIVAAGILKFMAKKTGIRLQSSRCQKCGKRVNKAEKYCFDHQREFILQAQEKHRLEGSGKFNRSQKRV